MTPTQLNTQARAIIRNHVGQFYSGFIEYTTFGDIYLAGYITHITDYSANAYGTWSFTNKVAILTTEGNMVNQCFSNTYP